MIRSLLGRPAAWLGWAIVLLLAAVWTTWWAGGRLLAGSPGPVGPPPGFLPAESIRMDSASGSRLSGWYSPGRAGRGGVLLLHGSGGQRTSMLGRARFLQRRGHSVLLIDFQAHGESPGQDMTSGYLESRDAEAAMGCLRQRLPGEALGIVGFSLGGAAALLGGAAGQADALVLEAVYTDIETAVGNRLALRLGSMGRRLTPLLLTLYEARSGIDAERLAPVRRLEDLATPLLIIGGSRDQRSTEQDTRRLYAAAGGPKALWLLEGAAHQDFHVFDTPGYERRVGEFLHRYLVAR